MASPCARVRSLAHTHTRKHTSSSPLNPFFFSAIESNGRGSVLAIRRKPPVHTLLGFFAMKAPIVAVNLVLWRIAASNCQTTLAPVQITAETKAPTILRDPRFADMPDMLTWKESATKALAGKCK